MIGGTPSLSVLLAALLPAASAAAERASSARFGGRDFLPWILDRGLLILIVIAVLWLVQRAVFLLIGRVSRFVMRTSGGDHPEVAKRARTLSSILRSFANVLIGAIGAIFILEICGVDVRPFLAGAGIVGVALGFGAQSLVRDCLSGIFILAENQIAVGDTITVAGVTGTVEQVTVRSTTLRDFEGRVHYVPNGEMRVVTNLTQGAARLLVDVPIPADADPAEAIAAAEEVGQAFAADPRRRSLLLEPPEVLGFETLGVGHHVMRVALRALRQDAALARDFRLALVRGLAARGIHAGSMAGMPPTGAAPPGWPSASSGGTAVASPGSSANASASASPNASASTGPTFSEPAGTRSSLSLGDPR